MSEIDPFTKANLLVSVVVLFISSISLYFYITEYEEKRNKDKRESIEQKLQKLYYPLRQILSKYDDISTDNLRKDTCYYSIKNDIQKIIPYSHLSSDTLYEPLNSFISVFDKNAALIVEKFRESSEKQKKNGSEKIAKNFMINMAVLDALYNSHPQAVTMPTETEAEEAKVLYFKILEIIKRDISYYQDLIRISEVNPKD